ncbi:hypothetical protein CHELA40_13742 [Chelatococcus asaccharovorans]|nr:hypothetical protein CHELA40_13742 [Chelatococcus asaccharovorans]CAH1675940.1 hypothetical protein CHELA17_61883 [Chelatococcus asaccharovorans]
MARACPVPMRNEAVIGNVVVSRAASPAAFAAAFAAALIRYPSYCMPVVAVPEIAMQVSDPGTLKPAGLSSSSSASSSSPSSSSASSESSESESSSCARRAPSPSAAAKIGLGVGTDTVQPWRAGRRFAKASAPVAVGNAKRLARATVTPGYANNRCLIAHPDAMRRLINRYALFCARQPGAQEPTGRMSRALLSVTHCIRSASAFQDAPCGRDCLAHA